VVSPVLETIKKHLPKAAGPADAKLNYFLLECLLFIFQAMAGKSPETIRATCGIFVPSGQPTDFLAADVTSVRDDLIARLTYLATSAKAYVATCKTAVDNIQKTLKQTKDEAERKGLTDKKLAVDMVTRSASNAAALAHNLVDKIPKFGTQKIGLSWKVAQQQQQQQAARAGGKRKSAGTDSKAGGDAKGKGGDTKTEAKSGRAAKRQKADTQRYVAPKGDAAPKGKKGAGAYAGQPGEKPAPSEGGGGGGGGGGRGRGKRGRGRGKRGGGGAGGDGGGRGRATSPAARTASRGRSNSRGRGRGRR